MDNFLEMCDETGISAGERFIVAAGVFDGVHLGHRRIIKTACLRAAARGARVMALSFKPHPKALLSPDQPPELLMPLEERVRSLREAGADRCCFINFTGEVAALEHDEFLVKLRDNGVFSTVGICVGKNWRFGRNGSGNRMTLQKFCAGENWSLDAVEELEYDGVTISSSAIRSAVAAGELDRAAAMLGREVRIYGTVERGSHVAGTVLETPTANLKTSAGVLPPDGVYCGTAETGCGDHPAVVNIGFSPTFNVGRRRVEIHLIGFAGDLYGRRITLRIRRFLRHERRFDSPEALKKQIAADIAAASAVKP